MRLKILASKMSQNGLHRFNPNFTVADKAKMFDKPMIPYVQHACWVMFARGIHAAQRNQQYLFLTINDFCIKDSEKQMIPFGAAWNEYATPCIQLRLKQRDRSAIVRGQCANAWSSASCVSRRPISARV